MTLIQPIPSIKIGDTIKLSINICNPYKMIYPETILWFDPLIVKSPSIPSNVKDFKNQKDFDRDMVCDVELSKA